MTDAISPDETPDAEPQQPLTRRELRAQREAEAMSRQSGDTGGEDTAGDNLCDARSTSEQPARSEFRAVLQLIGTGLMAGLLIFFIGIGVLAIAVPAVTGSTALTVMSSSMEPSLPVGTMVVVRPTPIDAIQPGAVLTYQLESGESTLVTHRVNQRLLTADGDVMFITQGDNNPQADVLPVREVQVVGTVWYAIPLIGWITNIFSGESRAIVVAVAVGGLILYAVWMFLSSIRDRRFQKSASPDTRN